MATPGSRPDPLLGEAWCLSCDRPLPGPANCPPPGSQIPRKPLPGAVGRTREPAAPTQQACGGPGHPDPSGQAFRPPSLEQRRPEHAGQPTPSRGLRKVCVLGSRRQSGAWGSPAAMWPGGLTLACSLSPAAGTASVGTSSCLSQHPSPSSVFRHHYIPYFRGKAREAAGCAPAARRASVSRCPVSAAAWLPRAPVSRPCSPLCLVCLALSVCPCSQEAACRSETQVARRGEGSRTYPAPTLGWLRSLYLSHPMLFPPRHGGRGGLLATVIRKCPRLQFMVAGHPCGCSSSQGADLPVCPTPAWARVCESVQEKGQFLCYGLNRALRFIC